MKQSRLFELEYKELSELFYDDSWNVQSPGFLIDQTTGAEREIDVLITRDVAGVMRKIGIECRDRSRVQGIDWIEEFVTKKNDVNLDIYILASTSGFSETAIKKAKHHGIILERAERINKQLVKDCSDFAYIDNYFLYYKFNYLKLIMHDDALVTFRDFFRKQSIVMRCKILNELNGELYLFICSLSDDIRKKQKIDDLGFFIEKNKSKLTINSSLFISQDISKILSDLKVKYIAFEVDAIPVTSSIPLAKSMASFYAETDKNKRYDGWFSNEEDSIRISYNVNEEILVNYNFAKRKYLRLVGGDLRLNTIIPDDKKLVNFDFKDIINKVLGEFDFSSII